MRSGAVIAALGSANKDDLSEAEVNLLSVSEEMEPFDSVKEDFIALLDELINDEIGVADQKVQERREQVSKVFQQK